MAGSLNFAALLEASVAQPGRASPCQGECRGFESLRSLHFLSTPHFPHIRRNDYRLIVAAHFNRQIVYTLRFMTHAKYSKDRWKDTL